ncbi:metal-dependent hydrolase [Candidatus Magnetomonas plexicatena]|uniref:metal-dependent hydrolase n=1 Tax=Candidatus Magnetomonas plexicatena TaxID=2552947 RepID=UPI001C758A64|nr:hypothetical protein E2O03_009570 [Nitrospirales bacterium LBB_01]
MPGFKEHLTFGLITGVAVSLPAVTMHYVKNSLALPIIACTSVGALIADFDSESSVPFHVASSVFAAITGVFVFLYLKRTTPEIGDLLIWTVCSVLAAKFLISPIIKKMTTHRGIWHSIPAAVISFLAAFLLLQRVNMETDSRFYLTLSIGIGYISHLVLDEGKSLFHFKFLIFWSPKKSIGSALKFIGQSKIITLFTYLILVYLAIESYPYLLKVQTRIF